MTFSHYPSYYITILIAVKEKITIYFRVPDLKYYRIVIRFADALLSVIRFRANNTVCFRTASHNPPA